MITRTIIKNIIKWGCVVTTNSTPDIKEMEDICIYTTTPLDKDKVKKFLPDDAENAFVTTIVSTSKLYSVPLNDFVRLAESLEPVGEE